MAEGAKAGPPFGGLRCGGERCCLLGTSRPTGRLPNKQGLALCGAGSYGDGKSAVAICPTSLIQDSPEGGHPQWLQRAAEESEGGWKEPTPRCHQWKGAALPTQRCDRETGSCRPESRGE